MTDKLRIIVENIQEEVVKLQDHLNSIIEGSTVFPYSVAKEMRKNAQTLRILAGRLRKDAIDLFKKTKVQKSKKK